MTGKTKFDEETLLVRSAEVIQANLGDDQLALMKARGEHYFGLEGPGSRIWALLETETTLGDLCDILVDEFDVAKKDCLNDTSCLIESLISEGLVSVADG